MPNRYINSGGTTLALGIGPGDTSMYLTNYSTIPTIPEFDLLVDQEVVRVTYISNNIATIVRFPGSTSHSAGAPVIPVLSADHMSTLRNKSVIYGTYAKKPVASSVAVGTQYYPTDGVATYTCAVSGSSKYWQGQGPIFPLTPPVSGNFSNLNFGPNTTIDWSTGFPSITAEPSGGDNLRMCLQPVTIPFTIVACFIPHTMGVSYSAWGVALKASASGRIITCGWVNDQFAPLGGTFENQVTWWNSNTFRSNLSLLDTGVVNTNWIKVAVTSGSIVVQRSANGVFWFPGVTFSNWNTFINVGTIDLAGFVVNSVNPRFPASATVMSWSIT